MTKLTRRLFSVAIALLINAPALAHEGGAHDATHQHHIVQGVEVTLLYQTRAAYLASLPAAQLGAVPAGGQFLVVLLARGAQAVDTRVKLKITDAKGQAVGAASGLEPTLIGPAQGRQYAFPVKLSSGQRYFVMVQFADPAGIQRSGFELPLP